MTIPLNPHLTGLKPYPPGKPIEEVKRELGLDRVIKLASNENPLGPSPRAMEALKAQGGEMHQYPEGHAHALRTALAERLGIDPAWLIFGNGSDEILMLAAMTFLTPQSDLIMSEYAFIRPLQHATMVGARVTQVPVIPRNFEQDVESMGFAIKPSTRIVYLANPNNPTGDLVHQERVHGLLGQVPPDCLMILDAAYHEYCADMRNYTDPVPWVKDFPNLMVLRTFSKAYGLAGLRCGYAIAHPEVIQQIERVRPPFNLTRSAQVAALAALEDEAHIRRAVEVNLEGMEQLLEGLANLQLRATPSAGNFLLIDSGHPNGGEVFDRLLRHGVIVRPMAGYGLPRHLRVSVGTEEENRLFLEAMAAVRSEMAGAPR